MGSHCPETSFDRAKRQRKFALSPDCAHRHVNEELAGAPAVYNSPELHNAQTQEGPCSLSSSQDFRSPSVLAGMRDACISPTRFELSAPELPIEDEGFHVPTSHRANTAAISLPATGYGLPAVFVKFFARGTKVLSLIPHHLHHNNPKQSWPSNSPDLVF